MFFSKFLNLIIGSSSFFWNSKSKNKQKIVANLSSSNWKNMQILVENWSPKNLGILLNKFRYLTK